MELYDVIPMLCSSTQHFSHGKYPVSEPTSGRAHIIMILEGKMIEPAIDRMVEFIMYVVLILTAISLGATTLLALYYLRSCLCQHGEADMASQYRNSDTELGLIMNGINQVSIPSAQPEHDQHSSGERG